jgi:hypothetical protein
MAEKIPQALKRPQVAVTGRGFLVSDFLMIMGLANLVLSSPLLNSILVPDRGYSTFNVLDSFLIPHLQGLAVIGALFYSAISISRYCKFQSRWLSTFVIALFLLFALRGFLAAAGIAPSQLAMKLHEWLTFIAPSWLDPVDFKRIGSAVFIGLVMLALFRVTRFLAPLFRACSAFGYMLTVLVIFRISPMAIADAQSAAAPQLPTLNKQVALPVARSVVWVIFDEFDYQRFFVNRNSHLKLPNIDRLLQEGVSATNATSPASATEVSIPALVSGTMLTGTEPVGSGRLQLKQGTKTSEWGVAPTIFSRLHDSGKEISILGFALPYCATFPYANPCQSIPGLAYPAWWWGIWVSLKTFPGFELLVPEGRKFYSEVWNQTTRLQLEQLERHISNSAVALSFMHFNIPHPPGGRVYSVPLPQPSSALTGYDQNALAVDLAVGKIVDKLELRSKSQEILLIVTSDHWLRADQQAMGSDEFVEEFGNDYTVTRKIPLLIRRMHETTRFVITQPVNTIHTAQLIDDFLAEKVTDHASIAKWWLDKPYFDSMIFARLQKY